MNNLPPPRYRIVIAGNEYMSTVFLIKLVEEYALRDQCELTRIASGIELEGAASFGAYSEDTAQTIIQLMVDRANIEGHPLYARMERI